LSLDHLTKRGNGINRKRIRVWAIMPVLGGLCVLSTGCGATARPDPTVAFKEISQRSLAEDAAYVRDRISPSLMADAGGKRAKDGRGNFVCAFMQELGTCKPQSWRATDQPDKIVMEVAGLKASNVRLFCIDLLYDKKHGWQLASKLYNERPLKPSKGR